jgi:hypothetical protein
MSQPAFNVGDHVTVDPAQQDCCGAFMGLETDGRSFVVLSRDDDHESVTDAFWIRALGRNPIWDSPQTVCSRFLTLSSREDTNP